MRTVLSPWSKAVKKAMIDADMNSQDLADKFHWTRQYVTTIVNGKKYYKEAVVEISRFFELPVPEENSTLARKIR